MAEATAGGGNAPGRPTLSALDGAIEEYVARAIYTYFGRRVHEICFGEYYAPGGGPDCGYRGNGQPNVNLRGLSFLEEA